MAASIEELKEESPMFHFSEPMPDCVPEYYRAKEEAEAHEYEKQTWQQERFERNRRKMEDAMEAGYPILVLPE